jgi:hypothetical protein
MKLVAVWLTCLFLTAGIAFASEEQILSPSRTTLTIIADAGKPFGEVRATIEGKRDEKGQHIQSISLTVAGKTFAVPSQQFADLRDPLIQTAEFRTEGGLGDGPWMYLMIRLEAPRGAKSIEDRPRVYFRYKDGKLVERQIIYPQ